ncbi:MAG TPA: NADP-dependent phosphogluconate dehydrogenase [Pyrinomonadaceae bacterium]|nr:NADP-dependent phosphogluconate dehydrogenase [Pyrinomonadaceae bacterium]
MTNAQFGMIGLGTMGRNFLLNVAEHGFSCVGYDLDAAKRTLLLEEGKGFSIASAEDQAAFVASLEVPRKIMLLIPAGPIVDAVIAGLIPILEKGDLIIDGGNSHFTDTERREAYLNEKGFEFLGVGVSGGEEGARHGASIMIGGNASVYEHVRPILEAVSAKVNGEPCAAYVGKSSAGHFVKMVHNGIEYGLMQILAETYDFMLRVLKMDYVQMSDTFAKWNSTELNSFLVEITAEVLRKVDAETGKPLVEMVLDKAAQKGTGKWTSQAAMDLGVPIPTIDSAVSMRQISAQKETRVLVAEKYGSKPPSDERQHRSHGELVTSEPQHDRKAVRAEEDVETEVSLQQRDSIGVSEISAAKHSERTSGESSLSAESRAAFEADFERSLEELKDTLLSSFIVTYAQGLSLLQTASVEKNYEVNLAEIAKIWRGGCIIRSALLEDMRLAFAENPSLPNLVLDTRFAESLSNGRESWHRKIGEFSQSRIPSLCLSSALAYFEAFRSERLPANLIQAQRDYFGAHTYQRTDKEGTFHTPDWEVS